METMMKEQILNKLPVYKLDYIDSEYLSSHESDHVYIDLSDTDLLEVEDLLTLNNIYSLCTEMNKQAHLIVNKKSILSTQLDFERLHRKFNITYQGEDLSEFEQESESVDIELSNIPQDWRDDVDQVIEKIEASTYENALFMFKWIINNEKFLYSQNLISPYMDIIPKLIMKSDERKLVFIIESLPVGQIIKLFFDDYTIIPDQKIARLFDKMDDELLVKLFQKMTLGVDLPSRSGEILSLMGSKLKAKVINQLSCISILKMFKFANNVRVIDALILCMSKKKVFELFKFIDQSDVENKDDMKFYLDYVSIHDLGCFSGKEDEFDFEPNNVWVNLNINSFDKLFFVFSGQGNNDANFCDHFTVRKIQENIDYAYGRKRVDVHLVEFDKSRFKAECYKSEALNTNYQQFLSSYSGCDSLSKNDFKNLGLFQLQTKAQERNIDIAINGNFYFDYGHHLYGQKLGLPLEHSQGLNFGDPVGLLINNYKTLSPAIYNRATFLVTEDEDITIDRVKESEITVSGEHLIWNKENTQDVSLDDVVFYNNIFGFKTPINPGRLELIITKDKILKVKEGGGALIPFTGFVVSIDKSKYKGKFRQDDLVVYNNYYKSKKIKEAIGCGPLLVQNGEIEINFNKEDFGKQDSSVMSFFLPRQFEKYEAARSFIGLRGDKVVIGAVSGCSYGTGLQETSTGMTFSELAMFCRDIGLETAMGLDGGGSSSIVTKQEGDFKILNTPTGGKDVPRGTERFISTSLMFQLKE